MYEQLAIQQNITQIRNITRNLKVSEDDKYFYVPHDGKYGSRIIFKFPKILYKSISSDNRFHQRFETVINPLWFTDSYNYLIENIGFEFNGMVSCIFGKYTKKNDLHYRNRTVFVIPHAPEEYTHILIKVMWGGSSASNFSGRELPITEIPAFCQYYFRSESNAGKCGADYYIIPIGYSYNKNMNSFEYNEKLEETARVTLELGFKATMKKSLAIDAELLEFETASAIQRDKFVPLIEQYNFFVKKMMQEYKLNNPQVEIYNVCDETRFYSSTGKNKYLYNQEYISMLDSNIKNARNKLNIIVV